MNRPLPRGDAPIRAVIFDLHATLIHDGGDPAEWLDHALALLEAEGGGEVGSIVHAPGREELVRWAPRIWEHAREIDPQAERDLGPVQHRRVFDALVERLGVITPRIGDALYRTMFDPYVPYEETLPVLKALRDFGIKVAILSNVGVDSRPTLDRLGLTGQYDVLLLSFEVGRVKPDPGIFLQAAEELGVDPEEVLMVGDSVEDDGGAAHVGMRTLILPRTLGPSHGLGSVLRLVGIPDPAPDTRGALPDSNPAPPSPDPG